MSEFLSNEEAARAWFQTIFSPTDDQWSKLDRFAALLTSENERQNLVSASTLPNIWVRHLADSAQLLPLAGGEVRSWIDLGSGAGLPGLVLAILSDVPMKLVESRKLRCSFLREASDALQLPHVEVVEANLESIETVKIGAISARAFAPLEKLIKLANRFASDETIWLLPKGRNAVNELASLPKAWQNMFHVEQSLTDVDSQILVGRGQLPAKKREKA